MPGGELLRTRRLIALGRHEDAASLCANLIGAGREIAAALSLRALAFRNLGRHAQAYGDLDRLVKLFPRDASRRTERGEEARRCGNFDRAEEDARTAMSLSSGAHGSVLLSEALRGLGRWAKAVSAADSAVAAAPGQSWPLVVRAKARRYGGDLNGALRDIAAAEALDPSDSYAWGWRGVVLRCMKRPVEAVWVLERAVRCSPRVAWFRAMLGEARRESGDPSGGLKDVLLAVRQDGTVSCAYDFLGAEPPAVRKDRTLAWIYAWRGSWRSGLGRAGATDDLDRALSLDASCSWARAWRGEALLRTGDFKKAARDLEQSVKVLTGYADAHVWLGRAKLGLADPRGALDCFRRAGSLDRRHALSRVGESVALAALGRESAARLAMSTACRLDPRLKAST